MKQKYLKLIDVLVFAVLAGSVFRCSTAIDPSIKMGTAEFYLTDAPVDDDNIKGVFVTVTDLKVNGTSIPDFTKQTIDIKALQQGKTQLLGTSAFIATSFRTITLVIDTDTDATGGTPGSYVQTFDDKKYKLRSGGIVELTINKSWAVPPNATATIVVDLDLRKAIIDAKDPSLKYKLAGDSNLHAVARVVTKERTGSIVGTYVEQSPTGADEVIVYAYKRGTFAVATEAKPQTADSIYFLNAVTSSVVKSDGSVGTYTIPLLEAGDYEIHFAAYKKSVVSDRYVLQKALQSSATFRGAVVEAISIQAGIEAAVSSAITGQ